MAPPSNSLDALDSLRLQVNELIDDLPNLKFRKWIERSLGTVVRLADEQVERLDWKILSAALQDMEGAFQMFYPYRHIRKISIFGSARISPESPEYGIAVDFARHVVQQGFMVMTGAGGGIMEAGNKGAGADRSLGLNIQLPFEQDANPFIDAENKLVEFKYFFTRKLFFLRESDAIALFPGGFGTQDEAFECLTLGQTGRFGPCPVLLIDRPGGDYWKDWDAYIRKHLLSRGLIGDRDCSIYTITDNVEVAIEAIRSFYRIYHSSRYVRDIFVIRLKSELSDAAVDILNQEFSDILVRGTIQKSQALPEETMDETFHLPRLIFYFNRRDAGRMYELIARINELGDRTSEESAHPERK
ncbi:LOG family protein [Phormidium sp. CCY1219]|uniref:LOG family protein n=1 Tax=Phormidium sp. CCY1219 TaxID=2886104 RepID=UPI002D1F8A6A|nr:LOG family protein [Phormidium sp. CCY1219]MEB3825879.1 LOG family protein [Phormidium sp. CCY1219]